MIFRFIKAMLFHRWAKWIGYQILSPHRLQQSRNDICAACEFNVDEQCQKCGCLVFSKIVLSLERCPVGKWGRVWVKTKRARRV